MEISKWESESTQVVEQTTVEPENSLLSEITPTNLAEQKALFFINQCKIDPIFSYNRIFSESKVIVETSYYEDAIRIVNMGPVARKKEYLSKQQILSKFNEYIVKLGIEKQVQVTFDTNVVSRTKVKHLENYSLIIIRDPPFYTQDILQGVMNHEVGTHVVRKINDRKQGYYKHRRKFGISPWRTDVEEGLAVLNQLLEDDKPLLFTPAIRYISSILAYNGSFCSVYERLFKYMKDENEAWNETVRVKRSIVDTSKKGGFYKDQAYFIGALEILKKRKQIDFVKFHGGKINLEDIHHVNTQNIVKPQFLDNQYSQKLNRIAIFNGLQ